MGLLYVVFLTRGAGVFLDYTPAYVPRRGPGSPRQAAFPRQKKVPGRGYTSLRSAYRPSSHQSCLIMSYLVLRPDMHLREPRAPDLPDAEYTCSRCSRSVHTVDMKWLYPDDTPTTFMCEPCDRIVASGKPPTLKEYAFTLTCAPTDQKTLQDMIDAAEYLSKYGLTNAPEERPCKFAYVVEHPETNFHIHGVYSTASGRRIAAKYFKRAWSLWDERVKLGHGHRGGYHKLCMDPHQYQGYLEKEGVVVLR